MKKITAWLLILILSFALVSCGGQPTPEPTPEPTPDSGETEPAPEPQRQLTIGFNTNNLTNETMSFMTDVFYKYGEENNIKILVSEDNMETAVTQNNLENMVAAGVDGIIFMNEDPVGVVPTIEMLKEKGIVVISYDEYSEEADYVFMCSNYDLGYAIGSMAGDWATEHVDDDEIIMGVMTGAFNDATTKRSAGIIDGFKEHCDRGRVYDVPATQPFVDCFYNMLSAEPNMKIFASLADSMVCGVAEAWYADLVGAGKDISEYGVFATDATDIALNLLNASKNGEGIFRGTIDLGLKDRVPLGMITCCHKAILGEDPGYERVNYYEVKRVMEDNVDEYSQFID